jgi:long-subunit acyl-CoA synthetase (AMP-forming)
LAAGLAGLHVRHGEPVALMLSNRPEFHIFDAAAMHLGAVPFSLYNTATIEQLEYVIASSGCRVIVTENAFLKTVLPAAAAAGTVAHVVVVDEPSDTAAGVLSVADLEASASADFDFEAAWRAVGPDDLVTLIYTSGTTGPPKCVELTHDSIIRQWRGLHAVFNIRPGGRILSWLPAAHIADRLLGQYQQICFGHQSTSVANARELSANLIDVRPTFWVAVPRIYEKFKASLEASMSPEETGAAQLGVEIIRDRMRGETVSDEREATYAALNARVLAPVRARLGLDQAEQFVVGASPFPLGVLEFFHGIGMPVCDVWGISELPIAAANPPDAPRLGTVGRPVPGVELKLAADGEILLSGPLRMRGYRNDPEKNAEAIDADGWFSTGDVGVIDEDGYLTITDRKKEIIINAAGKNMSPANIEANVKTASPLIGQAVAIGDGRPYNVALLVLDPDGAAAYARSHDLEPADVAGDPGALAVVADAIADANTRLARVEQIKRYVVLTTDWEPGGDELTPTAKLKRKAISTKYAQDIEALYA